jgi:nitroreductase
LRRRKAQRASMKGAAVRIVFSGMSGRSKRPGWMYLEAGAASENLFLRAVTMGLGTVTIGGFKDEDLRSVPGLGPAEQPTHSMSAGRK